MLFFFITDINVSVINIICHVRDISVTFIIFRHFHLNVKSRTTFNDIHSAFFKQKSHKSYFPEQYSESVI